MTDTPTTSTRNLARDYAATLDEIPNFITDETAQAGQRTYKYLNLGTILKAIKPIFAAHGVHFYQKVKPTQVVGNQLWGTVETIIFNDRDSETISNYPFLVTGDPQANGSAISYARRYSLYAALGIYPDKDDDGAKARDYYNAPAPSPASHEGGITPAQASQLNDMAKRAGLNLLQMASELRGQRVTRLRELTQEEGQKLTAMIVNGGAR